MRIIAKKALRDFWELHPDCEQALKAWFKDVNNAEWESFSDVKEMYNRASVVGSDRIVFRIRGNNYRLIVRVNYAFSLIFIKFIGTHAEYDRIDSETVDYY